MISFKTHLHEGGQASGKMEISSTRLTEARAYAELQLRKNDMSLDSEIPNFNENFIHAKKKALGGDTLRKDMPVIDMKDVKGFQFHLKRGYIDFRAPFATKADHDNPFPEGLSGAKAAEWLEHGLEIFDGSKTDDIVKVRNAKVAVGKLLPIQRQIYFDKAIKFISEYSADALKKYISANENAFIVSADNRIIDGHHRYLAGVLVDPKIKVNCVVVDLDIMKLLPLALSYSDAIGNKRNA